MAAFGLVGDDDFGPKTRRMITILSAMRRFKVGLRASPPTFQKFSAKGFFLLFLVDNETAECQVSWAAEFALTSPNLMILF
jgi:hypothetical protein